MGMNFCLFFVALMISAVAYPATRPSTSGVWATYVNARYGFVICYPENLLMAQGEADNSDGQTFNAPDGAELRAFGSNNVFNRSLTAETMQEARYYMGRRGKVTYRGARRGWAVISGDDGRATAFYTKTFKREDQFVTFQLKYPKAAATRYKPVVERLSSCFRLIQARM